MSKFFKIKRITKHLYLFFKTGYQIHLLEVEHYYLMRN